MPDIFDATVHHDTHYRHPDDTIGPGDIVQLDLESSGQELSSEPDVAPDLEITDNQTGSERNKYASPKNDDRPHRDVEEYSEIMRNEEASRNPLDAFAPKPLKVFFDSQDKSEQVILLLRKHPVTQIKWLLIVIVLIFVPIIFSLVPLLSFLPVSYQLSGLLFWYVLLTGFSIESFLSWFFNVYIITDERIIDVDFLSLIYKNITSAKIDNIEDITAETGGAIRSIFNYGTVKIQTAGTSAEIEFEDVPQPAKVTRLLNELLLEEEREKIEGRVN